MSMLTTRQWRKNYWLMPAILKDFKLTLSGIAADLELFNAFKSYFQRLGLIWKSGRRICSLGCRYQTEKKHDQLAYHSGGSLQPRP